MVHEIKGHCASGTGEVLGPEINQSMLQEFQKSNSESQCIMRSNKSNIRKERLFGIMTNGSIFCWIR
jgi:hypothetical protein